MSGVADVRQNNAKLGIVFIVLGVTCISINDVIIKQLSGAYPLHQMVFVRSLIGICVSAVILRLEGGMALLRTSQPGLHLLRALLMVAANMSFFAALAVIPLADATALFFVAPLFITLLSIPFLGEKVGARRLTAVVIGFAGVLIMLRPGTGGAEQVSSRLILLLPVCAAFAYACMQILTRRLGVASKASAMAIYFQSAFIVIGLAFWFVAGDGRYAEGLENPSLVFLLRAWTWPTDGDWLWFLVLGLLSGIMGYSLSQAYRSADAATVAPFEYLALPLSVMWGYVVFDHLPGTWVALGILLIASSGIYVFLRENKKARPLAGRRPVRRY